MQLFLTLLLIFSAVAGEPAMLRLGSAGNATVELQEANDKVELRIHMPDGSVQTFADLGEHVQFLNKDGKSGKSATMDFDGDGLPELVVRVTVPPQMSHVYVYRYDSELKKFRPMLFADDDHLEADYNEPVEVTPDGISYEMEVWQTEDKSKAGESSRKKVLWKFRDKRFLPF